MSCLVDARKIKTALYILGKFNWGKEKRENDVMDQLLKLRKENQEGKTLSAVEIIIWS